VDSKTKNATYGEQVELICTTSEHAVEWQFAGNDTMTICTETAVHFASDKYECKREANRHTLIINDVTFTDTGVYTCVDDEGRSISRDSTNLHVIGSCK